MIIKKKLKYIIRYYLIIIGNDYLVDYYDIIVNSTCLIAIETDTRKEQQIIISLANLLNNAFQKVVKVVLELSSIKVGLISIQLVWVGIIKVGLISIQLVWMTKHIKVGLFIMTGMTTDLHN